MAATTALSFSEYLATSFPDLDCEYADGEVRERSMPDFTHSRIQLRLGIALEKRSLMACPELRLMLRPGLVRIPDTSVQEVEAFQIARTDIRITLDQLTAGLSLN